MTGRGHAQRWQRWVAAAVCLVLLGMLLYDASRANVVWPSDDMPQNIEPHGDWWRFYTPRKVGADLLAVIRVAEQKPLFTPKYRAIVISEAARRATGGLIDEMIVPQDLYELGSEPSRQPGGPIQELVSWMILERMNAGRITYETYDPTLTDAQLRILEESGELVSYPRNVRVIDAQSGARRWRLFVDERKQVIYLVPANREPPSDGSEATP